MHVLGPGLTREIGGEEVRRHGGCNKGKTRDWAPYMRDRDGLVKKSWGETDGPARFPSPKISSHASNYRENFNPFEMHMSCISVHKATISYMV